jgi:KaiC/GvpD/RAD55 family RecA-like ATPase
MVGSHKSKYSTVIILMHYLYSIFPGIPYRRGYLLYGPPGCGKTSFMYVFLTRGTSFDAVVY